MAKQKILIVDDDENIAELISLYLIKECYDIKIASDGDEAIEAFKSYEPNLVLLDIMLPGKDGYQVCREIRAISDTPVIMLSAKGETFDKVLGLEMGADDYIMKPFEAQEMVARVKAVLRRYKPIAQNPIKEESESLIFADLEINLTNYSVTLDGRSLDMPAKEIELLYYLAKNPGRVYTREQILENIWGYEYMGDTRTVDVHVNRLREKIPETANYVISTVWGIGYKFEVK